MSSEGGAYKEPDETTRLLGNGPADPTDPNNGTLCALPITNDTDVETQNQSQDSEPQNKELKNRVIAIFPALVIGVFLSAADQTIIVSIYSTIGSELDALSQTSWIATAYFLTLTAFQPLYGKLSDIFGRKACLLFSYVVFGLGSLGCGSAQNIRQLIMARAFAGIGGAGMTTLVSIVISDVVTLRERGKWQGYINIVFAAGAGIGAPLGGVFADSIGWRWAFFAQAPLCLLAFLAVLFALHLPVHGDDELPWPKKLRRIDFLGSLVLLAAVSLLLLALDRGSNVSWTTPLTYISLIFSVALFLGFIFVELKVASEPIAPGHIIFSQSMIASYICNFFSLAAWMPILFNIPLFLQAVDGSSATDSGLQIIPGSLLAVCGSLCAGAYMQKTGRYYWLTVLSFGVAMMGITVLLLCSDLVVHSSVGMIVGLAVTGFAVGLAITTTLISLIANAGREEQAIATACSYLFRSLGSVFGVSMCATVVNIVLKTSLASELPALGLPQDDAYQLADEVRKSLDVFDRLSPEVRKVVVECYARSLDSAFGLALGFITCAFVASWFIHEKALNK